MTITGQAIRERILRKRPELGMLGKTTATAGSASYLTDTTFLAMSKLSPAEFGDAFVRITGVSNSDEGLVSQLERVDPVNGYAYLSPAAGAAIVSGTTYEIWGKGVRPDLVDAARDRALTERCSMWRIKPLSLASEVSEWLTTAYATGVGGVVNASAAATSQDFPNQYFEKAMRVTNSGSNGYISSESVYVQPARTYRLTGFVSVRQQSASVRVRDITNAADITLSGTTVFSGYGEQYFDVTFTTPASCGELQIWLGGQNSASIQDWAGVGLVDTNSLRMNAPARVLSEAGIGQVFARLNMGNRADEGQWAEVACKRQRSGSRVEIVFGTPPGSLGGVFYMEQHHYAALQTDYLTKTNRTDGDAAATDCPAAYIEAATIVELLENMHQDDDMKRIYLAAEKDLAYWDQVVGAPPFVVQQNRVPGRGPALLRL